ncbi:MAG: FAD-dependent oxidoreductase [Deltaproteobacteria bacterium]|nr:FAD-dependent oxidoreductase [Deltaproteobacteria bacterium]MBW2397780.1 FAD-dependent oxidoreductase [Deltaproteobacteria bacterium]
MQSEAKVVVIGGGVAGCSLLYHLTRLGWSDVLLLEKNELTSGSTWHAAGLCTQFNPSYNLMKLLKYSLDLYENLEAETGQAVDLHRCGSVRLATTQDRLDEFEHRKGIADQLGIPFEIISPERTRELFPLADTQGTLGAAYLPTDGYIDPTGLTNALAKGAVAKGARILRHTGVTAIERDQDGWRIETSKGEIRAEIVVNAAGQWARQVGQLAGLDLPIVPIEHHFLLTEPMDVVGALETELPILRDPDASFYVREEGGGLIIGPFERNTVPWALDGVPDDFHSSLLPPDLDRLEEVLIGVAQRVPAFADAGIKSVVNGPDGYTPDGRCLMGPVPGLRNFHVLAGFSIFGIVFGGGAGKYAAEWIVDGQPSDNMWEVDVSRFDDYASSTKYVAARACEVYEHEYAIHYPEEERPAGRPLKTSPLYDHLRTKGAVFGARFGWERPLWFARDGKARDEYSFRRGNWHTAVGEECKAVRSRVGVLDQTSFAKYEVSGPGAERFLDRLCANRLPARLGRIVLTQMCTPRGGVECDVTVTRLAEDRFYVVSAAATERHDFAWIERHLPDDGSVRLDNVSNRYGVLTLAGPRSREVLQALTDHDCSHKSFRFFRCQELYVGMAPIRALRLSYVGELGYELHHPIEYQRYLYDLLMEAGAQFQIADWGYRALDSMRLEKAYRLWGVDMTADWTPLQAGMDRFVALDKGDFIGRDALLREQERGVEYKLTCLVVNSDDADPHGYEPVLVGDEMIGYLAAGGYGHTVEKTIALAYLPSAYAEPGTDLEVKILGARRSARVVEQALYDPENKRLLS